MEYTYTIPTNEDGTDRADVILRSDGAWIPVDEGNADYQQYLADNEAKAK